MIEFANTSAAKACARHPGCSLTISTVQMNRCNTHTFFFARVFVCLGPFTFTPGLDPSSVSKSVIGGAVPDLVDQDDIREEGRDGMSTSPSEILKRSLAEMELWVAESPMVSSSSAPTNLGS